METCNNKIENDNKEMRYNKKYLEIAEKISELSHANRKKVGCIIVKDTVIISDGFNGTPTGFENKCEDSEGVTKWYTLHAEANAIAKLAQSNESSKDAELFCTYLPCLECAKLIHQAGIKKVYYREDLDTSKGSGREFLENSKIKLECVIPDIE